MQHVKIFLITCTEAPTFGSTGEIFSLSPWGKNTRNYKGFDDGGKTYILPDDYSLAQHESGNLYIRNKNSFCCYLINYFGIPCIVDIDLPGTFVKLDLFCDDMKSVS